MNGTKSLDRRLFGRGRHTGRRRRRLGLTLRLILLRLNHLVVAVLAESRKLAEQLHLSVHEDADELHGLSRRRGAPVVEGRLLHLVHDVEEVPLQPLVEEHLQRGEVLEAREHPPAPRARKRAVAS